MIRLDEPVQNLFAVHCSCVQRRRDLVLRLDHCEADSSCGRVAQVC